MTARSMSAAGEAAALPPRPAEICAELLAALEASEGRRRRRVRDTTPDAIGLRLKRELLEDVVRDDPDPSTFDVWLAERCLNVGVADGPVRAMAMSIWEEWQLAASAAEFRTWRARGAPSVDREGPPRDGRRGS